ncbi:MAG TPA: methylmalonyl Co-A mutase-associated GTPase MeaB [Acidimicrobiia bacterium]|nr:methylmalonyl Co-A mutase-associated GTPase MeaB [Acidimicrobiia bacterium]
MPVASDPESLVEAVTRGDRRALARLISILEDRRPGHDEVLSLAFAAAVPAHRVGITGAPGAGKSTLTDALIRVIREGGDPVAVLAVDPTSPFSGGAVLGDRVRMQDHVLDDGVFVRSMASRGHLGGLSAAAPKALLALEAAGFPHVIIETVGVGQDEVEVAAAADTVIVVVTPGWGDGIQAAKAGILEIGDVFVVNKADRVGADDAVADLRTMLSLGPDTEWEVPIVQTVATKGSGIRETWEAIASHRAHLGAEGLAEQRRSRRRAELETALVEALRLRAAEVTAAGGAVIEAVEAGDLDPWTAARRLTGT